MKSEGYSTILSERQKEEEGKRRKERKEKGNANLGDLKDHF